MEALPTSIMITRSFWILVLMLGCIPTTAQGCGDAMLSMMKSISAENNKRIAELKRSGDCSLVPIIMAADDRFMTICFQRASQYASCGAWCSRKKSHAQVEHELRRSCKTKPDTVIAKSLTSDQKRTSTQQAGTAKQVAPSSGGMQKSSSCSDITGTKSTGPAVTHCKDANTALHAARVNREKYPAISAEEYKKAAAAARRAGDANLELSILREATTAEAPPNPFPASPQESSVVSRRVDTPSPAQAGLPFTEIPRMEAGKCSDSIRPEIKAIDERIAALEKAEPPYGGGDQVPVGSCASRLAKLYRHGLVFGPGPGLTTVASKAANFEERSCLELKKAYLEKACKCTKQGLSFSMNEAIEDQTLEAYVEIQKLDKKWRDKAIKDPVINKIVTEAAKIRDCFNLQTVEILRDTEKKLEGALAEPAQDSTREVPTQKPQQDPLTRP